MINIAIETKALFLKDLEMELSSIVTVSDMSMIMAAISNQLAYYDLTLTDPNATKYDDLLDAYLSALKVQGLSKLTIERYRYILQRMMDAVNTPTRNITVYHLRKYLSDEKERGISDRSLEGMRQVFSAYFNWLQREGLITNNPTANLGTVKYAKKTKETYTEVDIEKLKCCCRNVRDRAIICFLASTGCRISEMTQLNRDDVDLKTLECVVFGKGSKERIVYLDAVAGMLVAEYLQKRKDDCPALFVGQRNERITPHGVRKLLNRIADVAGVEHVHPHKFRRTLATTLIRHGMPIQEVAAILGHDKLDTTMQYVVLDKTDIKNSYRKYA